MSCVNYAFSNWTIVVVVVYWRMNLLNEVEVLTTRLSEDILKQGAHIHLLTAWLVPPWHAHSHITRAVAVMDSCFTLIWAHQHGIANLIYIMWSSAINVTGNTSAKLNASSVQWQITSAPTLHRKSQKPTSLLSSYHRFRPLLPSKSFHQGHRTHYNSDRDGIRKAREGFLIS